MVARNGSAAAASRSILENRRAVTVSCTRGRTVNAAAEATAQKHMRNTRIDIHVAY